MKNLNEIKINEKDIIWNNENKEFGIVEINYDGKNELEKLNRWHQILGSSINIDIKEGKYIIKPLNVLGNLFIYKS